MSDIDSLSLVSPGCLGMCWYGRYHYLEPWVGCEHACNYCYARFRSVVANKIKELGTSFEKPVPLFNPDDLINHIKELIKIHKVEIFKLSRYTDIFTSSYVKNGLSYRILETLCQSPVERIIITTKGFPSKEILNLIAKYPQKFSYNVVAKPDVGIVFEPGAAPLCARIEIASQVQALGALTTIHMDPMIVGIEDDENVLRDFFQNLKEYGLTRVMFSYLLLSDDIVSHIKNKMGEEIVEKIISSYEMDDTIQCLPNQVETAYFNVKPEKKKESIERIAGLLQEMDFKFVLCSIKNEIRKLKIDRKLCGICDGSFYA